MEDVSTSADSYESSDAEQQVGLDDRMCVFTRSSLARTASCRAGSAATADKWIATVCSFQIRPQLQLVANSTDSAHFENDKEDGQKEGTSLLRSQGLGQCSNCGLGPFCAQACLHLSSMHWASIGLQSDQGIEFHPSVAVH